MAKTVKIEQQDDVLILVNGKEVHRDLNGRWLAKEFIYPVEAQMFHAFLRMQQERHTEVKSATYQL